MKVLLDENLPHDLRSVLTGHEVFTVAYMKWTGVKNGELLRLAEAEAFEVFVTADYGIQYQQNPAGRVIALVYLTAQKWEIISVHVDRIAAALDAAEPGSFQIVECGQLRRE